MLASARSLIEPTIVMMFANTANPVETGFSMRSITSLKTTVPTATVRTVTIRLQMLAIALILDVIALNTTRITG